MKIGNIKEEQQITWREWRRKYYEDNKEYVFGILRLWKPDKYPSYRLDLIENKTKIKVRKTLNEDVGSGLEGEIKGLGADKLIRLVIRKNGDIETEVIDASGYMYEEKDKYWRVVKYEDSPF